MGRSATAEPFDLQTINSPQREPASELVIDLVHLSRQTLGDSALESELLTLFDRQAQQLAIRLGTVPTADEARWRAEMAHTLKGSARAIGAFHLGDAAEAYEAAIRSDASDLTSTWRRLQVAIDRAHEEIGRLLR